MCVGREGWGVLTQHFVNMNVLVLIYSPLYHQLYHHLINPTCIRLEMQNEYAPDEIITIF